MLMTLTSTHEAATDLGFLLRKNPARSQSFSLSFGKAHVFYPEATPERCTVALLVEVDPVGLVRNRRGPSGEGGALEQYVNDRPYAASSFLSVAIAEIFGSALAGKSKERPELADTPLPLRANFSALPCRGRLGSTGDPSVAVGDSPTASTAPEILRRLFEPLGYTVSARRLPLDEKFPDWGESSYFHVELSARLPLRQLLSHLYVLVPVLDNDKHYWVGDDEVEKLLHHGEGWLTSHPEREAITRRYLKHQRSLVDDALAQLTDGSEPNPDAAAETRDAEEAALEASLGSSRRESAQTDSCPMSSQSGLTSAATDKVGRTPNSGSARADLEIGAPSLNEQRLGCVLAVLKASGATRVLDLGCGEGRLLQALLKEKQFTEIVGMDVSHRALEIASDRLHYDRLPPMQKERIRLLHGSLIYRDQRLAGFDAAAVVEVIEHLDAARLAAFERVLFECAKPKHIVITTPNREYNVKWETLPDGKFRHRDHRFEWARAEFHAWANGVAARFGYNVRFLPVGPEDLAVGSPTQMAVFQKGKIFPSENSRQ
jgi:SAM-dependent methyltransferase